MLNYVCIIKNSDLGRLFSLFCVQPCDADIRNAQLAVLKFYYSITTHNCKVLSFLSFGEPLSHVLTVINSHKDKAAR